MAAPKDADVRSVIRGILVSTPNQVTARQLDRDFLEMEGYNIPYSKFGFKTLLDYLRSITDTVSIMDSSSNPVVLPVTSGKSSHVEKLVSKQRSNPSSKRGGHHSMPQRRRPNKVSHSSSSRLCIEKKKQDLVSHMPNTNPKTSVDEILPGCSTKTNDQPTTNSYTNPFHNRLTINMDCLERQLKYFKKYNSAIDNKYHPTLQPQSVPNAQNKVVNKELVKDGMLSTANGSSQNSAKKKMKSYMNIANKHHHLHQPAFRRLTGGLDESSVFSLTVAAKMRRMSPHQRQLAAILMNKVLDYGLTGTLTSVTDLSQSYRNSNLYYNEYYGYYYFW